MTNGTPAWTGLAKRPEIGIVGPGDGVDHVRGEIGVPLDVPQPREVLGGRVHAGLSHPAEESHAVAAGGGRVVTVLALQHSDGLVLRDGVGRDDVHDRGEVHAHAGRRELAPPLSGVSLQDRCGQMALVHGGRDDREPGAPEGLDQPALLVRRHVEPHAGRRFLRGQCLDGIGHRPDPGHADGGRFDEPHRAEVVGPDRRGKVGPKLVSLQSHQEQLAHPLLLGHPFEDLLGARG